MSFNRMVKLYDETRIFDIGCFNSALDYLVDRFPPSIFNNLFEPGIGTGRIAIPLAERGYQVTGVDISEEMLEMLSAKLMQMRRSLPISFRTADVVRLPLLDDTFHILAWDLASGGTIIYHLVFYGGEKFVSKNEYKRCNMFINEWNSYLWAK